MRSGAQASPRKRGGLRLPIAFGAGCRSPWSAPFRGAPFLLTCAAEINSALRQGFCGQKPWTRHLARGVPLPAYMDSAILRPVGVAANPPLPVSRSAAGMGVAYGTHGVDNLVAGDGAFDAGEGQAPHRRRALTAPMTLPVDARDFHQTGHRVAHQSKGIGQGQWHRHGPSVHPCRP